jgi:hypothetical protein
MMGMGSRGVIPQGQEFLTALNQVIEMLTFFADPEKILADARRTYDEFDAKLEARAKDLDEREAGIAKREQQLIAKERRIAKALDEVA